MSRDLTACTELSRPDWPCLCARHREDAPQVHERWITNLARQRVRQFYRQKRVSVKGGHVWEWRRKR